MHQECPRKAGAGNRLFYGAKAKKQMRFTE